MSDKRVMDRRVPIALGVVCIILAVGLVGVAASYESLIRETIGKNDDIIAAKDQVIEAKDSQVRSLNYTIESQNNTIAQQNRRISGLEEFADLMDQIFFFASQPYHYDGYHPVEWTGTWELVTTFGGASFHGNTSIFQIQSNWWRYNYSQTGETASCQIDVSQVIGSKELHIHNIAVGGPEDFTIYIRCYSELWESAKYYFEMSEYAARDSWTLTVEQLVGWQP